MMQPGQTLRSLFLKEKHSISWGTCHCFRGEQAADSQSYAAGDASGGVAAAEAKTGDFGTASDEDFDVPF